MSTGTINFFTSAKPYGFITSDETGAEVIFYTVNVASDLTKKLSQGVKVSYELKTDNKGVKSAQNIQIFKNENISDPYEAATGIDLGTTYSNETWTKPS